MWQQLWDIKIAQYVKTTCTRKHYSNFRYTVVLDALIRDMHKTLIKLIKHYLHIKFLYVYCS